MDFNWESWKRAESQRRETARQTRQARLLRAQKEAQRLAGVIHSIEPRVTKVVLFGSVARQNPASDDFDIDLAVAGADSLALLEPEVVAKGFRIDLVSMEHLSGRILENIQREGLVLYGK